MLRNGTLPSRPLGLSLEHQKASKNCFCHLEKQGWRSWHCLEFIYRGSAQTCASNLGTRRHFRKTISPMTDNFLNVVLVVKAHTLLFSFPTWSGQRKPLNETVNHLITGRKASTEKHPEADLFSVALQDGCCLEGVGGGESDRSQWTASHHSNNKTSGVKTKQTLVKEGDFRSPVSLRLCPTANEKLRDHFKRSFGKSFWELSPPRHPRVGGGRDQKDLKKIKDEGVIVTYIPKSLFDCSVVVPFKKTKCEDKMSEKARDSSTQMFLFIL